MNNGNNAELASAFAKAAGEVGEFWQRMGEVPDLKGKRVLDLGCGVGAMCVWAAKQGASSVVGVDSESRLTEFAANHVAQAAPEVAGALSFWGAELDAYAGEAFDVVISKDVFEHAMDLPGLLAELRDRLAPRGKIYAGFGPLYHSPFGHHGRTHAGTPWKRMPWVHLLQSEHRICARLNAYAERGGEVFRYSAAPIRSIKDLGLSMIPFSGYVEAIRRSGLSMAKLSVNRSRSPLSGVLSVLRKLPFLKELCTHNMYLVLEETAPDVRAEQRQASS